MTSRRFLPAIGLAAVLSLLGACEAPIPREVTHVAEYYVERYNDSVFVVDTLRDSLQDSIALATQTHEIDSLTADWTLDDWRAFWYEVDRLRKP
jgi:hypothetical protein